MSPLSEINFYQLKSDMSSWSISIVIFFSIMMGFFNGVYAVPTNKLDSSDADYFPKEIKLEILHGHEIAPYVKEIVQFVNKIYRNYPYFYNGDDTGYEAYLESFPNLGTVIVCLAFEGTEVVGIAVGLPMPKRHVYQETLLEHGYELNELFYLGEFGLKPELQGKDIELSMYQQIENVANRSGRFKKICLWEIEDTLGQKAPSYFPNDDFWKQIGFIRHPELNFQISWTNVGDTKESTHKAVYWMKNLTRTSSMAFGDVLLKKSGIGQFIAN